MDAKLDRPSTHPDRHRLFSSLHHQTRAQRPLSSHLTPATFVSLHVEPRQGEPALDESILARRTAALRQLNGNPRPLSRRHRQTKSSGGRSSTLASQPVLVRSYSDEPEETMPSITIPSQPGAQQRVPELPLAQDFSIEGILRAIEPDIRNTLDSIAEICGRSKLSLANEYGSHIAPFGEIRAPLGGLLTVEEASPSTERLVDDNVVILDDDNSLLDGRDYYGYSTLGMLDNLRQAAQAMGYPPNIAYSYGDGSSLQALPDTPRSATILHPPPEIDSGSRAPPFTKEFIAKPKPGGRAFLGKAPELTTMGEQVDIMTPAVVSEVHLDARADASSWPSIPPDTHHIPPIVSGASYPPVGTSGSPPVQPSRIDKVTLITNVQAWLSWLKGVVQQGSQESTHHLPQSAESTLRTVLERQGQQLHCVQEQSVTTSTG